MDWNLVGRIAEILGTIAVLFTLLDIARQTRESNAQKRAETFKGSMDALNNLSFILAQSSELSSVVARGRDSYLALPKAEQLQFQHFHGPLLNIVENWLFQINTLRNKGDRDATYVSARQIIRTYFDFPGALEFWEQYKEMFPKELRQLIHDETEKARKEMNNG
jgi:hypothetical protein